MKRLINIEVVKWEMTVFIKIAEAGFKSGPFGVWADWRHLTFSACFRVSQTQSTRHCRAYVAMASDERAKIQDPFQRAVPNAQHFKAHRRHRRRVTDSVQFAWFNDNYFDIFIKLFWPLQETSHWRISAPTIKSMRSIASFISPW